MGASARARILLSVSVSDKQLDTGIREQRQWPEMDAEIDVLIAAEFAIENAVETSCTFVARSRELDGVERTA